MPKISPLRTLLVVYSLAVLAGICEYVNRSSKPRPDPDIYGGSVQNFPETMSRLYPNSPYSEYLLGRRFESLAGRSFRREEIQRNPTLLQEFVDDLDVKLREAARHYERAIAMGLKTEENLYYNYALTLIRIQDDSARIDRAIDDWRHNFPFSDRRDLQLRRKSIEEQLRQFPAPSTSQTRSHENHPQSNFDSKTADFPARFDSSTALGGRDVEASLGVIAEWRSRPGYVGSQACRECHALQFESFAETAHSRTLSEIRVENEPADKIIDHVASGRRYRVAKEEGNLMLEESLSLDDGTEFPLTRIAARYRVGSGHFARTYLCDAGSGFLVESPVSWYESAQAWDMTPGFEKPSQLSFSRQILENCLWCHAGLVETRTTSDLRFRLIENSIGCERCHGPGETHVHRQTAERTVIGQADGSIVNPQRLTRKRAEAICQQCHLQGDIQIGGRNARATNYRPGDALESFSTTYRMRKGNSEMTVVGHVEQLAASECYRRSDTLTCVTCHDPHLTVNSRQRAERFRSVCTTCHSERGCPLPIAERDQSAENDCVRCHMPKSPTEVTHLAFTHHRIGIHPMKRDTSDVAESDPLIPLSDLSGLSDFDRNRSLMLARLQMFLGSGKEFHRSQAGQRVRGQVDQWLRSLSPKEMDVEIEFAKSQFLFAGGDYIQGERSAAIALADSKLRSEEKSALLEQLGLRDFGKKQFERARPRFDELTRLRFKGTDWFYLGICEEQCGKPDAAIRALETARKLEPANVGIYEALVERHRSRADFDDEQRLNRDLSRLKSALIHTAVPHPR